MGLHLHNGSFESIRGQHKRFSQSQGGRLFALPRLTIDETTAHITAVADVARELLVWFHVRKLSCCRQKQAGICNLDVLDFGNPSTIEEQRIREVFDAWLRRGQHGHLKE